MNAYDAPANEAHRKCRRFGLAAVACGTAGMLLAALAPVLTGAGLSGWLLGLRPLCPWIRRARAGRAPARCRGCTPIWRRKPTRKLPALHENLFRSFRQYHGFTGFRAYLSEQRELLRLYWRKEGVYASYTRREILSD